VDISINVTFRVMTILIHCELDRSQRKPLRTTRTVLFMSEHCKEEKIEKGAPLQEQHRALANINSDE